MKIIKKQGIFQVEDWSEHFSLFPYIVGCYPMATRHGGNSIWYSVGEHIRIAIDFKSLDEAMECFDYLSSGEKNIKKYEHAIRNKKPLAWIE